jgi:hypothetical protein
MGFTTGALRPLEQTRHEWIVVESLETYFEAARDVLIDAGVAVRNPNYDSYLPYSEEILITF